MCQTVWHDMLCNLLYYMQGDVYASGTPEASNGGTNVAYTNYPKLLDRCAELERGLQEYKANKE